jgi:SAM-dependent methyltransferase
MNCTLCNTALKNRLDKHYFICSTCGGIVKDEKYYLTPKQEKSRYEEHNNDVNDTRYQQFTAPITELVIEKFDPTHLGLDYGCGTGPVISKQLKEKGYEVQLYDPYFFPDNEYMNYNYDYIFGCEVFEHFHNPKHEIEKLLNLLKPNGNLIIMTHLYDKSIFFDTWYYRNDATHVFIFTELTIHYLSEKYDLTIERLSERLIVFRKNVSKSN